MSIVYALAASAAVALLAVLTRVCGQGRGMSPAQRSAEAEIDSLMRAW